MTTNDELQAALKALGDKLPPYEYAPEFVRVIKAAEAHAAAQQQRIDELEAALEPFSGIWRAWLDERVKPVPGFSNVAIFMRYRVTSDPYENHLRNAYEALRGKGAE